MKRRNQKKYTISITATTIRPLHTSIFMHLHTPYALRRPIKNPSWNQRCKISRHTNLRIVVSATDISLAPPSLPFSPTISDPPALIIPTLLEDTNRSVVQSISRAPALNAHRGTVCSYTCGVHPDQSLRIKTSPLAAIRNTLALSHSPRFSSFLYPVEKKA